MPATSSGSSCSAVDVKPTRSAKRTVMTLRSRALMKQSLWPPAAADVGQHAEDDRSEGDSEQEPKCAHRETKEALRRLRRNTLGPASGRDRAWPAHRSPPSAASSAP